MKLVIFENEMHDKHPHIYTNQEDQGEIINITTPVKTKSMFIVILHATKYLLYIDCSALYIFY